MLSSPEISACQAHILDQWLSGPQLHRLVPVRPTEMVVSVYSSVHQGRTLGAILEESTQYTILSRYLNIGMRNQPIIIINQSDSMYALYRVGK